MDSWSFLLAIATLTSNTSTIYGVGKVLDALLIGIQSVRWKISSYIISASFHSLHSMRPALWKSHG